MGVISEHASANLLIYKKKFWNCFLGTLFPNEKFQEDQFFAFEKTLDIHKLSFPNFFPSSKFKQDFEKWLQMKPFRFDRNDQSTFPSKKQTNLIFNSRVIRFVKSKTESISEWSPTLVSFWRACWLIGQFSKSNEKSFNFLVHWRLNVKRIETKNLSWNSNFYRNGSMLKFFHFSKMSQTPQEGFWGYHLEKNSMKLHKFCEFITYLKLREFTFWCWVEADSAVRFWDLLHG